MSIGRAPRSAARGQLRRGPGEACGAGGPPPGACRTAPESGALRSEPSWTAFEGPELPAGLLGAELAHPLKPALVVTGSFADTGIRL